jgi:hypothetical protein
MISLENSTMSKHRNSTDSAVATLDPPITGRVPLVGDRVFLYFQDESKRIAPARNDGIDYSPSYVIDHEAAIVVEVTEPGNPASPLQVRTQEPTIATFKPVTREAMGYGRHKNPRLIGKWSLVDEEDEPIWREPDVVPSVGAKLVCWVATWDGCCAFLGEVVADPHADADRDGDYIVGKGSDFRLHASDEPLDELVCRYHNPEDDRVVFAKYCGGSPRADTWGWEPVAPPPPPPPVADKVPAEEVGFSSAITWKDE